MDSIFRAHKLNSAVGPEWRDGVKMAFYKDKLHQLGGYNIDISTCNEHHTSDDGGVTWTQLSDAPWGNRHDGGCGVYDGKLWIWFGDNNADLWWYTEDDGWNEVTTILNGLTAREHSTYALINGYAYIMMGSLFGDVPSRQNNIYRIDLRPESEFEWELYSEVTGDMANIDSACLVNFKGYNWFFAGGRIQELPHFVNKKIWKSADLITWQLVRTEQLFNSGIWGNAVANADYICYISGTDENNIIVGPNSRVMFSKDGRNWEEHDLINIGGRHATAICAVKENFILSRGWQRNDCWEFQHIASKYRSTLGILN